MKKLRYALLILTLLSPVGLFAQADASDHGPAGGPRRGMMSVDDELNMLSERLALTDAQKPQVKTILQDQRDQMKKLMEDSSTGRDEKFPKMREIRQASSAKITRAADGRSESQVRQNAGRSSQTLGR